MLNDAKVKSSVLPDGQKQLKLADGRGLYSTTSLKEVGLILYLLKGLWLKPLLAQIHSLTYYQRLAYHNVPLLELEFTE